MSRTFKGTINLVTADNLAIWDLGGYIALASALRKCVYCMATGEDMRKKVIVLYIFMYLFYGIISLCRMTFNLVLVQHIFTIVHN